MATTKIERRAHVNAWIDERDRERLVELARERDRSFSAELRRAIAAHVRKTNEGEDR
jgi:hypothetical protein